MAMLVITRWYIRFEFRGFPARNLYLVHGFPVYKARHGADNWREGTAPIDIFYSIPKIDISQKTIKNYWGYDISWLEIDFSSYDIPDIPHFPTDMVFAHINYSSMYPKKLQIPSEKVFSVQILETPKNKSKYSLSVGFWSSRVLLTYTVHC